MSDIISRQVAIDAIDSLYFDTVDDHDRAKEKIKRLPSAQPERKTGRWKRRIVDSGYNADWICSECGYRVKTDFVNYNYCPNCGADMRGEQE